MALTLDLTIRAETAGKKSLDDVMRALWQRYGRDFYITDNGRGIGEEAVDALFDEITGLSMQRLLDRCVRGTEDLPLAAVLAPFGVTLAPKSTPTAVALGVRTSREGNDCKLASVHHKSAAHRAGLSAGDVLVALDGLRVTSTNLTELLRRYRSGDSVALHAFRRDELMEFKLKLALDDSPNLMLHTELKPVAAIKARRAWLG